MKHPVIIRERIRHYIENWPITEFPDRMKKDIRESMREIVGTFVKDQDIDETVRLVLGWMTLPEDHLLSGVSFDDFGPREWHAVSRWLDRRVMTQEYKVDFVRRESFADELRALSLMVWKDIIYSSENGTEKPLSLCVSRWNGFPVEKFIEALSRKTQRKESS